VPCRNSIGRRTSARSAHARQRRGRLRLRGHAAAERLAARDERQRGQKLAGGGRGGAHRRLRQPGRVGPLAALLHVGELIAQGGDAARAELVGDGGHERVRHAGARAVREQVAGARAWRREQQARDAMRLVDRDGDGLCCHGRRV
jgi:hypothetical protein